MAILDVLVIHNHSIVNLNRNRISNCSVSVAIRWLFHRWVADMSQRSKINLRSRKSRVLDDFLHDTTGWIVSYQYLLIIWLGYRIQIVLYRIRFITRPNGLLPLGTSALPYYRYHYTHFFCLLPRGESRKAYNYKTSPSRNHSEAVLRLLLWTLRDLSYIICSA